jgi:hypothetical protein
MGPQNLPKGVKKLTIEEKAAIIAFRKIGMKTPQIVARTGRNATSRELGGQGLPQRKRGSGRPRKVTSSVLKSLKRQISKYPYMTTGQLRARRGRPLRPQCSACTPEGRINRQGH